MDENEEVLKDTGLAMVTLKQAMRLWPELGTFLSKKQAVIPSHWPILPTFSRPKFSPKEKAALKRWLREEPELFGKLQAGDLVLRAVLSTYNKHARRHNRMIVRKLSAKRKDKFQERWDEMKAKQT